MKCEPDLRPHIKVPSVTNILPVNLHQGQFNTDGGVDVALGSVSDFCNLPACYKAELQGKM